MLFGYDTGVIAGALLFIKTDFGLSNFEQGLVVAAVPIGAVFGAAFAGPAADRYGRRQMILAAAGVFTLGLAFAGGNDGGTFSSVLAIGSLMVYVASFAISLGPIFRLLNAEMPGFWRDSGVAGQGRREPE